MNSTFESLFWAIGAAFCTGMAAYYVIFPRKIHDAPWYGHLTEYAYLYIFPPTFTLFALTAWSKSFELAGLERLSDYMAYGIIGAAYLWVVGFLAMLGVPMPSFLTPKWIRDRRKADREAKRRRRAERKAQQAEYARRYNRE